MLVLVAEWMLPVSPVKLVEVVVVLVPSWAARWSSLLEEHLLEEVELEAPVAQEVAVQEATVVVSVFEDHHHRVLLDRRLHLRRAMSLHMNSRVKLSMEWVTCRQCR